MSGLSTAFNSPKFDLHKHEHSPIDPYKSETASRLIKNWELVGESANGTFCMVYRAKPAKSNLGANYAIKVLKEKWLDSEIGLSMLKREQEVGSYVSHKHLIPVLDHSLQTDPPLIVQPWIEGRTLKEHLIRGNRPDARGALWIARHITEALTALEDADWIHNDIQPGNVMISPEGHVTLIDLGFAQKPNSFENALDRSITGTLNYIAPEQIFSPLSVDIRSDFFSIGILLYEMFAGDPPFDAISLEWLSDFYSDCKDKIFKSIPHSIPMSIADLILDLTSFEIDERPRSARELLGRLVDLEIGNYSRSIISQAV